MVSIAESAHKIVYLASKNQNKNLAEVIGLLEMPAIDINVGIFYAEDQGWLKINKEEGTFEVETPVAWQFGSITDGLQERIEYLFEVLARKEKDFEENMLKNWAQGYPDHDIEIALHRLVELEVLTTYTIKDEGNTEGGAVEYTFYTLWANRDKEWGRKEFARQDKVEVKENDVKASPTTH